MSALPFVRMAAGVALVAVFAGPASAQQFDQTRTYAVMYGGVSSTEVSAASFGGSFGFNLAPSVQVFGEVSRSQDVKAPFTNEDLTLMQQGLSQYGIPFTADVKMAVNYYRGGIKYLVPFRVVRPYFGVDGGMAHMSPATSFTAFGRDVTSDFMSLGMNEYFREQTRPMAGLHAGALFTAGHVVFDAAYKYSAIFITTDFLQDPSSPHSHTTINTHQFTGGVGVRF